jgi:hypothetical protein
MPKIAGDNIWFGVFWFLRIGNKFACSQSNCFLLLASTFHICLYLELHVLLRNKTRREGRLMLRQLTFFFIILTPLMSWSHTDGSSHESNSIQIEANARMLNAAKKLEQTVSGKPNPLFLMFDNEEKTEWAYWPKDRAGLRIQRMTAEQRGLLHDLLSSLLSSQGYMKVINIMQLENVLAAIDTDGWPREIGDYTLAIFGSPSAEKPWSWRFEGHHVSLNVTVLSDSIAVTPSFLGASPASVTSGPLAGLKVLRFEAEYGLKLALSLNEEERQIAVEPQAPPMDILSAPYNKNADGESIWKKELKPTGISVAQLSQEKKLLVQQIVDEVITNYRPEISTKYLRNINLEELYFVWRGEISESEPYYYRLQGSDFIFEFDSAVRGGNHIHTVWHGKTSNFGEDLLMKHYKEVKH